MTPDQQIALIRSFIGHADGRAELMLARVRRVLDGATLEDLIADEVAGDTSPEGVA